MPKPNPARLLALAGADRADFLLLALPNAALREACRRLGCTFPGFRLEKVEAGVMADALAEVYEESEQDAATIDQILDECCPLPLTIPEDLVPTARIPRRLVELLTRLAATDPEFTLAPLLWRLLGHPVENVRAAAVSALRSHMESYDALAGEALEQEGAQAAAQDQKSSPAAGALRRQLKEAESKTGRLAVELEAVRKQLAAERAHSAQKDERLSRHKRDLERTQADLRATRDAKAALEAERDRDARALLRSRESEAGELRREVAALQLELKEARRREADLVSQLRTLEAPPHASVQAQQPPPAAAAEPASSFQVPYFTDEFYESIEEWDPRILKSAFEKVLLLANDFAHPSLDAKRMQGADGLYRIRIGTDVRLFYRRKPNGGIEVLSLIDRENLGRYVRRYKGRAHT